MRSKTSHMFVLITFLIVAATLGETKDQLAVQAVLDNAIQAAKTGDANRYLVSFADDAILAEMVPGQAPIVSKKALRPWIKDFLEKFTFDWSDYKSEEVLIAGNLAFHRYTGVAVFTPKEGGQTSRLDRRYLDILRRGSDGRWRISHHIYTPQTTRQ